jgi:hypothetical protein
MLGVACGPILAPEMLGDFAMGQSAGLEGKGFLDNPFDSMSGQGRRWIDGLVLGIQQQRKWNAPRR